MASSAEYDSTPRLATLDPRDDRCDDCAWPRTCEPDRTCWNAEAEASGTASRERRAEATADRGLTALDAGTAGEQHPEETAQPDAATSEDGSPAPARTLKRRGGRAPRFTAETAIAAVQAYAAEHGHPPAFRDLPMAASAQTPFGSWAALVEAAGFERPTRQTKYGKPATPAPRFKGSPPERGAEEPAPDLRAALLGLLDAGRVVVEVVFPEER